MYQPSESLETKEPMQPFEMQPIPEEMQENRSWQLSVNGEPIADVSHVELTNAKMGVKAEYGKRPEGYDGVIIREMGGAATIPYFIDDNGSIYVGLVKEYRPTMGEPVTANIPRGFTDFGETKDQTAARELKEETGLEALAKGLVKLAEGQNPNSTWLNFSHDRTEGVDFYAVEVKRDQLELNHDDTGHVFYEFPATIREQAEGDKAAERILGSVFVPLSEARKSRDMFTHSAAGDLLAHLVDQGEYIVPQNSAIKRSDAESIDQTSENFPAAEAGPSAEEIAQAVKTLEKLKPGFLPFEVFNEVARLVTTPTIELTPLRTGEDGRVEVFMTQRSADDPFWPGEWHVPGTVIRSTDKEGDFSSAIQRLKDSELMHSLELKSEPVSIGSEFRQVERGREIAFEHYIEVSPVEGAELPGKFFPVDELPEATIDHHREVIAKAVAAYKAAPVRA